MIKLRRWSRTCLPRSLKCLSQATMSLVFASVVIFAACGDRSPTDSTGSPDSPVGLVIQAGDGQSVTVGTAVATPPAVRVYDGNGRGVAGTSVTFSVISGGGNVTGNPAVTNGDGIATLGGWTLGTAQGTDNNTLQAVAAEIDPMTFTASATPGSAAVITIIAGDAQSATVGTAVAVAPGVRVDDQFGNPVAAVSVTFSVISGGGNVTGNPAVTNGDGIATLGGWTLGTAQGTDNNTLQAVAAEIDPMTFTASATPGSAAVITIIAGDAQSATVGTAVAVAPGVRVDDQFGNPVPGVSVAFTSPIPQTVTGGVVVTDANGIVQVGNWIVSKAGPNADTLTASTAGASSAVILASGVDLQWTLQSGLPQDNSTSVWGVASTDLYSAGGQNLTHFDGSSWTAVSHPVVGNVYRVWGSSSSDIYAATATAILHYDGTTWSSSAGCAQQCIAVGGTSSSNVFVAGDGPLRRFDGSTWSDIAPNPGVRIEGLFGLATNSVYFVGRSGTLIHWDGTTTATMTSGTTENLNGVWGTDDTNVYAVGSNGTILHYDGSTWSPMTTGTTENIVGIWGTSPFNIYAAGKNGVLLRYDGQQWSQLSSGTTVYLGPVFGFSATQVYIAGGDPAAVLLGT